MPVIDIVSAALSRPAARVIEGPVRALVNEVLQDRGYASPAEVQALRDDLASLRDTVTRMGAELADLRTQAQDLHDQAAQLQDAQLQAQAAAAPPALAAPLPAVAAPPAALPAAPPAAQRFGFSLVDYEVWLAGKLPGFVGPDGYVDIAGVAWRVDPGLQGKAFRLTSHKNPRVMVDSKPVSKTRIS